MSSAVVPPPRIGRLEEMDLSAAQYLPGFDLELPVLVLWKGATAEIDLRGSRGRHWHFRPRPGSLDYYAAGHYESYRAGEGRRHKLVLRAAPAWLGALDGAGIPAPLPTRMQFQDRMLERLMTGLAAHQLQGEPQGAMYSDALIIAIADRLHRPAEATASAHPDGPVLRPVLRRLFEDLIEERLDDPPSIEAMAALAAMGTSQFLRAFRLGFGMPPHQYVLAARVARACRLLAGRGEASLAELAVGLGFASHAHFTTVFRARTGMTPSAYRRSLTGRGSPPAGDGAAGGDAGWAAVAAGPVPV